MMICGRSPSSSTTLWEKLTLSWHHRISLHPLSSQSSIPAHRNPRCGVDNHRDSSTSAAPFIHNECVFDGCAVSERHRATLFPLYPSTDCSPWCEHLRVVVKHVPAERALLSGFFVFATLGVASVPTAPTLAPTFCVGDKGERGAIFARLA